MESTTLKSRIRKELTFGWGSMLWGSTSMKRMISKAFVFTSDLPKRADMGHFSFTGMLLFQVWMSR